MNPIHEQVVAAALLFELVAFRSVSLVFAAALLFPRSNEEARSEPNGTWKVESVCRVKSLPEPQDVLRLKASTRE